MIHRNRSCETCDSCCTKIERLGVTIGRNRILEDVDLHFHCGELTLVIGPNGAGKTTLLRAILGELRHEGRILFLDRHGKTASRLTIGYVPQKVAIDPGSPVSVFDLFVAGLSNEPVFLRHSAELRERVISDLRHVKADHLIDKCLGDLSGGELQKVLLSLALDPVPKLLLLDEPLRGMDANGLRLFYSMVSHMRKHYDLAIILVSHDFNYVTAYADRVVCLDKTVIASGPADKVFRDKSVQKLFGMDLERYVPAKRDSARTEDMVCWDGTCGRKKGRS